jgi:hypothetical protein
MSGSIGALLPVADQVPPSLNDPSAKQAFPGGGKLVIPSN